MMSSEDLQARIVELCYSAELTMQVIFAGVKNVNADKALLSRLIDPQLETYVELRRLLTECEQTTDRHLENYDSLLHQLRTDYLLLEHGIVRQFATG